MKALLVIIMSLCLHVTYAQKPDTTKTFIQGKELGEVVVKSSYLTREGDHILAIPTKEQRRGYEACPPRYYRSRFLQGTPLLHVPHPRYDCSRFGSEGCYPDERD